MLDQSGLDALFTEARTHYAWRPDPVSDDERRGLNVIAQSDPRGDGAINGVSDTNEGDVHAAAPIIAGQGERRVSPPLVEDAGMGDGDISISGGAAGGA